MTGKELKTIAKDIYGRCKRLIHGRLRIEVHTYQNFLEVDFHVIGQSTYVPLRVSRNATKVAAQKRIFEILDTLDSFLLTKSRIKAEEELLHREGKRLRKLIEKSWKDAEKA